MNAAQRTLYVSKSEQNGIINIIKMVIKYYFMKDVSHLQLQAVAQFSWALSHFSASDCFRGSYCWL